MRTMCSGRPPPSARMAAMFSSVCRTWPAKSSVSNCCWPFQPTCPPTNTSRSPTATCAITPFEYPRGGIQPGGCRIFMGSSCNKKRLHALAQVVGNGGGAHAAQVHRHDGQCRLQPDAAIGAQEAHVGGERRPADAPHAELLPQFLVPAEIGRAHA